MSVIQNSYFGRFGADISGNKNIAAADSGVIQNVTANATLTLPATVAGMHVIVRNGGVAETDGKVTVTVSPNANDKIMGNGAAGTDDTDVVNTNGRGGDLLHLVGDGVNGWFIVEVVGDWA